MVEFLSEFPDQHPYFFPVLFICAGIYLVIMVIQICIHKPVIFSKRIIFSGGPSAGKSTIADIAGDYIRSSELLSEKYSPLVVPETASILINAGMNPRDVDHFQTAVYNLQRALEYNISAEFYDRSKKVAVIQDRSTVDGFAYIPKEKMRKFKLKNRITYSNQREAYYGSLILFLESTSGHLDYATNGVRYEEKKEAFERSKATEYIYRDVFGDKVIFVPAENDFQNKVKAVLVKIAEYLLNVNGDAEKTAAVYDDVDKFISSYQFK